MSYIPACVHACIASASLWLGVCSTLYQEVCSTHSNLLVCKSNQIRCSPGDKVSTPSRCVIHTSSFTVHNYYYDVAQLLMKLKDVRCRCAI